MATLPQHRCRVVDPGNAMAEIRAFLGALATEGERPWCEVWYPAPTHLDAAAASDWDIRQADTFDAVELVDGEIITLPPYDEMLEGE